MASLDGRIDCAMTDKIADGTGYYDALNEINCSSYIEGKTTLVLHSAIPGFFKPQNTAKASKGFYKAVESDGYTIAMDTNGTLLWESEVLDGRPLLCVVSENCSTEYLDYLKSKKISYIVTGSTKIDLQDAMEILNSEFKVKKIALVGGGHINGSFLKAKLIDEVSIMFGPGIDGRKGFACAFDGLPENEEPIRLQLTSVKQLSDGTVWLRYKV